MLEATMSKTNQDPRLRRRLYTLAEIAAEANYSIGTVRLHVRKGALRVIRVGPARSIRVTPEARREYLGDDTIP